jgi:hypothetical protein
LPSLEGIVKVASILDGKVDDLGDDVIFGADSFAETFLGPISPE